MFSSWCCSSAILFPRPASPLLLAHPPPSPLSCAVGPHRPPASRCVPRIGVLPFFSEFSFSPDQRPSSSFCGCGEGCALLYRFPFCVVLYSTPLGVKLAPFPLSLVRVHTRDTVLSPSLLVVPPCSAGPLFISSPLAAPDICALDSGRHPNTCVRIAVGGMRSEEGGGGR